jgi:hypothetical protein
VNVRSLAALVALAGCNAALGLDPGTPLDPEAPSCLTGWRYRTPIDIDNGAGPLVEYQVLVTLDARAAIAAHELSGDDLRFALDDGLPPLRYEVEGELAASPVKIWVAVPELPNGRTRLYAYWGNPSAAPWSGGSPFVDGVVANASFEESGAWTIDPQIGPPAAFGTTTAWASDASRSLGVDLEVNGDMRPQAQSTVSQIVTFPPGGSYVVRFDLDIVAASYGNLVNPDTGASAVINQGGFSIDLGNGFDPLWSMYAIDNITGPHMDLETEPIGPGPSQLRLGVTITGGAGHGYAKGNFDHLRVRRYASPEPTVAIGAREAMCD